MWDRVMHATVHVSGVKQTRVIRGANACHTLSERVTRTERSSFTHAANAFTVSGTRASHATQTLVTFFAYTYHL